MNKEEFIGKLQMVYVGDRNAFNEIVEDNQRLKNLLVYSKVEIDRLNNIINEAIGFTNSHFKEMVADEEAQALLNILNKGDNKDVKKNNTHSN